MPGSWIWWFWLFFIHDKDTKRTGRCRQLMVIWSIKNDRRISCNGLDLDIPKQLERESGSRWKLNGICAAWYFDGKRMHENFILENSRMILDCGNSSLRTQGRPRSSFILDGGEFVTRVKSGGHGFEFRAHQEDWNPAVGPVGGILSFPFGRGVDGTRLERLSLSGTEMHGGRKAKIKGTAYFQKIHVAVHIPQWYWGMYHFKDGSILTFMVTFAGALHPSGIAKKGASLTMPLLPVTQDISFYHAGSGRHFRSGKVSVVATSLGGGLWSHAIKAKGPDFELEAFARPYAHSCLEISKTVGGPLHVRTALKYNEYPAVLESLKIRLKGGERIALRNGWGNMENSWGFIF